MPYFFIYFTLTPYYYIYLIIYIYVSFYACIEYDSFSVNFVGRRRKGKTNCAHSLWPSATHR